MNSEVQQLLRRARVSLLGVVALFAAGFSQAIFAQDIYPSRPIKFIVGFPAGGGTDAVLRAIAAKLTENLGISVVVENKPGANGNIAGEMVSKAVPDGYTFLYNTSSMVLSPYLYPKLNYDYTRELVPVALTANIPFVLAVPPSFPPNNIKEFVAYLKANPNKINYATAGEGNVTHLATVLFLQSIGAQATHIPYKGEAPGLADLLGGQVQFMLGNSNSLIPQIKQKNLKGIASASLKRIAALPELTTLTETILPGVEYGAWSGVMAPAGTPKAIVTKMNIALNRALQDPELREKIISTSAEIRGSSEQEYASFLKSESDRWGKVIRGLGLTLDDKK